MKQLTKRLLSLVLCFVMVMGVLPLRALNVAAETVTAEGTTVADDGNDFPEYPNQGAIRIDKTAQAVGTFSQTGMAKVELSMTGVPYSTGSEVDVVLVLDASNSMKLTYDNVTGGRLKAAKEAAYELVKQICQNKDGTFNTNRVAIVYFGDKSKANYPVSGLDLGLSMSYQQQYGFELNSISALGEGSVIYNAIYNNYPDLGGTYYSQPLAIAESILRNARKEQGYDRQQFCVFMSDGEGSSYQYVTKRDANGKPTAFAEGYSVDSDSVKHDEYFTSLMKYDHVSVYAVGTGMTKESNANAYGLMCNMANSKDDVYFVSDKEVNANVLKNAFSNIASKITQAATDVIVEDQISDDYTMIFDLPTGPKTITGVNEDDFCIEFVEYALDGDNERTGTPTSINKLKLVKNGNVYSANASSPVFEPKTIGDKGTKYYWTTDVSKSTDNIQVNGYYFTKNGDGTHNMTSGAYANGTINDNNMSEDLIIATPYYVYKASTRMLYWTVDKLTTTEYALSYYVYLKESATHIGENDVRPAGTYPTNDHATIDYTNHLKNDVSKDFPVPKMAWNGAQVSYVFYLVNEEGKPINSAGQVVDFANAVFVTDIFTKNVVWNDTDTPKEEGTAYLDADYEAGKLLSEGYTPYDAAAKYELKVYEDAEGNNLDSYFTIDGTDGKAGTTKVYNTKAGVKYSDYNTYNKGNVSADFDFANTTVAFGVVWSAKLVEDTIVVDYGLDTLINVTRNDLVTSSVSGIGQDVTNYGKDMNTGLRTDGAVLGTSDLTIEGHTVSIEDRNTVRFHQGNMLFDEPIVFYYESPVTYYENTATKTGHMYSSVTVIPATTIYYEDEYVTLKTFTEDGTNENGEKVYTETPGWTVNSQITAAVQEQDRPGKNLISAAIDADNNYGYDKAYENMSSYSMENAACTTVKAGTYATAEFEFYGTGFDIISLTSGSTGVITINVYDEKGTNVVAETVDTYYGYKRNTDGTWEATATDDTNALYQVPVMKVGDGKTTDVLPYGKYKAVITASYIPLLDHNKTDEGYKFYLDAIRIYNPTGNINADANNAYVKDGEGWPKYFEVRDQIISKETFDSLEDEAISGIVFIDGVIAEPSVEDYKNYGPNNELYLAHGQAVAFDLNADANKEVAKIQMAIKTVGGTGKLEVYGVTTVDGNKVVKKCLEETISTATDMYYDVTALEDTTVVIKNAGGENDAMISITNVKVTYNTAPVVAANDMTEDAAPMMFSVRRSTVDTALLSLTEEPETEEPGTEEPGTEEPGTEEPGTEEPGTEEPGTEEPGTEDSETGNATQSIIKFIGNTIRKLIGWIFG